MQHAALRLIRIRELYVGVLHEIDRDLLEDRRSDIDFGTSLELSYKC